ncbi:Hsp20/alpha crystallin family protein [Legionella spiritensis]|uniref:Hsp20/alpha crystallin family protein n=1 Tax=Legionella spiritensis TaxID=452 RepID=UPI000F6DD028|nr:Hsp20/alpha crystallin family protein [Legionella spiritensis]VEG90249.1 heat shock protein [Legionella spiritensis]
MNGILKRGKGTSIPIERTINPMWGFHRSMSDALKDFYNVFESGDLNLERFENRNLFPAMDVVEADDHFNIELEMPGMGEEDINVSISENRLIIKGEKTSSKKHKDKNYLSREIGYGCYERTIELPPSADVEKASASFRKGMLWVKIPKRAESKNKSRKIKVDKA